MNSLNEDIKILENYIYNEKETMKELLVQAIENLLKRYKELEEENKERKNNYINPSKARISYYDTKKGTEVVLEGFIPISVIQNKIDEYREKRNKLADGHFWDNERNINEDTSLFIAIETLKLLLEERNK